jgi:hypothetical protein
MNRRRKLGSVRVKIEEYASNSSQQIAKHMFMKLFEMGE